MDILDQHRRWNVAYLQNWLNGFSSTASGRARRARLGRTGEYVVVEAAPLPDEYRPDEIDMILLIDQFPSLPPIGVYVLNRDAAVVRQLRDRFNAFENRAFHDAPSLSGYTWICFHYAHNQWRYDARQPHKGDNLRKFLASFFAAARPT